MAPSAMPSEDEEMLNTAERRGSATASTSSSASTFSNPDENQKDGPTDVDLPRGKAHRRVSFTTATTIDIDPPSVMVTDDITCHGLSESPCNGNVTASADPLPACKTSAPTSCCSPSPRKLSRRTSLCSLEDATPHHSNLAVHSSDDEQASRYYSSTYLQFSKSFPSARPNSPYRSSSALLKRPSSRRTSLDSCSTHSSVISSSCYSTAGSLAELLYSRDTGFQRNKLLECIEVLSRHLSGHAVQQLMQQVHQYQEQSGNVAHQIQEDHRGSSVEAERMASATIPSKTATKNEVAATQPRRYSQPVPQKDPNATVMSSPKRRSCCFVRHMSLLETEQSETEGAHLETSEHRRRRRRIRTQQSLERMSSTVQDSSLQDPYSDDDDDESLIVPGYEEPTLAPWAMEEDLTTYLCIPPEAHRSALLLCDISGFTALSNTLSLQALSETINAYFQRIVTCIQEYGGDVVKFAGDAVIAEWRQEDDDARLAKQLLSQEDPAGQETRQQSPNAVQLATACACQIVQTCSDYHVYEDMTETRRLATLNVHCGIGVGTLVGFHAGDDTRREYMLLGDPISQAAEGIALGQGGEVVASPQAYACLSTNTEGEDNSKPRVVFSSRRVRDQKSPGLLDPDKLLLPPPDDIPLKTTSKHWKAHLKEWNVSALFKLHELMSLYVHPVVVEGELFTSVFHRRGLLRSTSFDSVEADDSSQQGEQQQQCLEHEQRRHQSEAELRRICTVFVQPEVPVNITGVPAQDEIVMETLNKIMVFANRELARFNGQLRQFIVDDKGKSGTFPWRTNFLLVGHGALQNTLLCPYHLAY
jgi:class 3 adenylate cyclase